MAKVFIDGSAGTTGLRIHQRLAQRTDITLLALPDDQRKDPAARAQALHEADIAFLCLPDASAIESVSLAGDSRVIIIDTSTAHRTSPEWAYGFPELKGYTDRIRTSKRIANPGCHATGFISLIKPLRDAGMLSADAKLSCFSLTGYSGGGKSMIGEYTSESRSPLLDAPRQYGMTQGHKHLPEMKAICCLDAAPIFCPVVGDYYCGMEVTVMLHASQIRGGVKEIGEIYADYYREGLVHYHPWSPDGQEGGFLSASAFAGRDDLSVTVTGSAERILLISRFDNLGKGASGAAIQNMNLVLGCAPETGLCV